jgi:aryl-alcohol dehydrogenase-like predicted oxidoreductase
MLARQRFESEYAPLYERHGYGTTVWSPLAQGVLTGRFNDGVKADGTRFTNAEFIFKDEVWSWYFGEKKIDSTLRILKTLGEIAKELGYTQTQLALAWAMANKDVSTLILGISKIEYIDENFKAFELYKNWNKELEEKIQKLLDNNPATEVNFRTHRPLVARRTFAVLDKKIYQ